jgi:predicted DNA-binding WGR domain protein
MDANKKFCLLKNSDGERGFAGKKKIYEIIIDGNKLTFSWGMAEKSNRQTKVQYFYTNWAANQAAQVQMFNKINGGYELAYEV